MTKFCNTVSSALSSPFISQAKAPFNESPVFFFSDNANTNAALSNTPISSPSSVSYLACVQEHPTTPNQPSSISLPRPALALQPPFLGSQDPTTTSTILSPPLHTITTNHSAALSTTTASSCTPSTSAGGATGVPSPSNTVWASLVVNEKERTAEILRLTVSRM